MDGSANDKRIADPSKYGYCGKCDCRKFRAVSGMHGCECGHHITSHALGAIRDEQAPDYYHPGKKQRVSTKPKFHMALGQVTEMDLRRALRSVRSEKEQDVQEKEKPSSALKEYSTIFAQEEEAARIAKQRAKQREDALAAGRQRAEKNFEATKRRLAREAAVKKDKRRRAKEDELVKNQQARLERELRWRRDEAIRRHNREHVIHEKKVAEGRQRLRKLKRSRPQRASSGADPDAKPELAPQAQQDAAGDSAEDSAVDGGGGTTMTSAPSPPPPPSTIGSPPVSAGQQAGQKRFADAVEDARSSRGGGDTADELGAAVVEDRSSSVNQVASAPEIDRSPQQPSPQSPRSPGLPVGVTLAMPPGDPLGRHPEQVLDSRKGRKKDAPHRTRRKKRDSSTRGTRPSRAETRETLRNVPKPATAESDPETFDVVNVERLVKVALGIESMLQDRQAEKATKQPTAGFSPPPSLPYVDDRAEVRVAGASMFAEDGAVPPPIASPGRVAGEMEDAVPRPPRLWLLPGANADPRAFESVPNCIEVTKSSFTVGRGNYCDAMFDSASRPRMVSKLHATLHVGKSLDGSPMLEVTDRGSTNGTFVDGSKIFQRTALRHGSRIMFGNFPKQGNQIVFMVELPGGGGGGGSDWGEGVAKSGASPGCVSADNAQYVNDLKHHLDMGDSALELEKDDDDDDDDDSSHPDWDRQAHEREDHGRMIAAVDPDEREATIDAGFDFDESKTPVAVVPDSPARRAIREVWRREAEEARKDKITWQHLDESKLAAKANEARQARQARQARLAEASEVEATEAGARAAGQGAAGAAQLSAFRARMARLDSLAAQMDSVAGGEIEHDIIKAECHQVTRSALQMDLEDQEGNILV